MGLSLNTNKNTEIAGGWTYIISQEMSFAQPGSGSFKGFLALGNKENASEFGGQGHKLCYYFTQGDYKTWESKKGISDAIDIEVIENERVVIDGKTLQKYNLILKND